jgi:PAS domain S-box-containing protein
MVSAQWLRRHLVVSLILLIGILVSLLSFLFVRQWEWNEVEHALREKTAERTTALQVRSSSALEVLHAVVGLYAASQEVTQSEFEVFVSLVAPRYPEITAVMWVPRVPAAERQAFVQAARGDSLPDYDIVAFDDTGAFGKATGDFEYFPVRTIAPRQGHANFLGLDLASVPIYREALSRARDSGNETLAGVANSTSIPAQPSVILAFHPVYRRGPRHDTVRARRQHLAGFVGIRLDVGQLTEIALRHAAPTAGGLDLYLYDGPVMHDERLLYFHASRVRQQGVAPAHVAALRAKEPIVSRLQVADRIWSVVAMPVPGYFDWNSAVWTPVAALAIGLLFTGRLAAHVKHLMTRRQQVEELAAQRTAELRDSETYLQALSDHLLDGFLTVDDTGHIKSFNHTAARTFGYDDTEVINKHVSMLLPEPQRSYIQRYERLSEADIIGANQESQGQRRDGSTFPIEVSVSELRTAGQPLFLCIFRDITERKQIDRMKNDFISTVSHELRTPLTSIRGALGLVAGGATGQLPAKAQELIEIASNNSDRLVRLINDILDIEKIESGAMQFAMSPQALVPLLEQAIEANQSYAEQYGVRYELRERLPEAQALVDPDRIMQVMTNLLSNAAKFSEPGDVVEIAMQCHNDRMRVAVTDHGSGIPEEFQAQVFQKFAQADASNTRQKGGTGLGLSICKAIIEKHQGRIDFETTPGSGTTFYFELPVYAPAPPHGEQADRPVVEARRILICEDNQDVAMLLKLILQRNGYEADIAHDAQQTKAMLAQSQYQAITLDLQLPEQNGISLLRELRGHEATKYLPVIVVSGMKLGGLRELNGTILNVVDWLDKPIDQQRLLSAVRRAVRRTHGTDNTVRVLHVEDDRDFIQVFAALLGPLFEVVPALSLQEAKHRLEHESFDLIILDIGLPDGSGLDLLSLIKRLVPPIPIVILSAYEPDAHLLRRVDAVLVKSRVSNAQLLETINALIDEPN